MPHLSLLYLSILPYLFPTQYFSLSCLPFKIPSLRFLSFCSLSYVSLIISPSRPSFHVFLIDSQCSVLLSPLSPSFVLFLPVSCFLYLTPFHPFSLQCSFPFFVPCLFILSYYLLLHYSFYLFLAFSTSPASPFIISFSLTPIHTVLFSFPCVLFLPHLASLHPSLKSSVPCILSPYTSFLLSPPFFSFFHPLSF